MTWTAKKNRALVRLLREYHPSWGILADRIEAQSPARKRAVLSPLDNYIEARRPARKRKFAFDDDLVASLEPLCQYYLKVKGISRNATITRIAERLYNEIGGKKAGPSVWSIRWRLNDKLKKREAASRSAPPEIHKAEDERARRTWQSMVKGEMGNWAPITPEEYEDLIFERLKDKLGPDVEKA
jgi:hypothetical protein